MFEYKRISKHELEQVVRNASQKIGVNEVILEKDYWVCFVLNYLFSGYKWKDAFKIGYLIWWKLNWALAIVIPTKYIEEMIRFCDKMTEARYINRDDERMKVFFKQKGVQICYPLPCLVEHRQNENSLIGFGENKGRKAIKFIDDENT